MCPGLVPVEKGSGVPFGESKEGDAGGSGDNVCELDVGLCDEVGDRFYSRSYESLAFFVAGTGDEGNRVVNPNGTIRSEINVPHGFAVTGK